MTLADLGLIYIVSVEDSKLLVSVMGTANQAFSGVVEDAVDNLEVRVNAYSCVNSDANSHVVWDSGAPYVSVIEGDYFSELKLYADMDNVLYKFDKPLVGSYSLNDVRATLEMVEGYREGISTLSDCIAMTPIFSTAAGAYPTQLSDWENYPVAPPTHFSAEFEMQSLFHLDRIDTAGLTNVAIWYDDRYDHAGQLEYNDADFIFTVPVITDTGQLSVVFDTRTTAASPNVLASHLNGMEVIGYNSKLMRVYNVNGGDVVTFSTSVLMDYVHSDSVFIWSQIKVDADKQFIAFSGNTKTKSNNIFRHFYSIVAVKSTGKIHNHRQKKILMTTEYAGPYHLGGYLYKIVQVDTTGKFNVPMRGVGLHNGAGIGVKCDILTSKYNSTSATKYPNFEWN